MLLEGRVFDAFAQQPLLVLSLIVFGIVALLRVGFAIQVCLKVKPVLVLGLGVILVIANWIYLIAQNV